MLIYLYTMSIRFTNCVLALDGTEVKKDLYISPTTGKILPDEPPPNDVQQVIDLGGRLLSPGMIDIQLNGALGFDFSTVPEMDEGMPAYASTYLDVCKGWIKTGVTSFLPTIVTNPSTAFQKVRQHCKFAPR
jgi:N-acetylglucosamine-6-phosphate deacetylase